MRISKGVASMFSLALRASIVEVASSKIACETGSLSMHMESRLRHKQSVWTNQCIRMNGLEALLMN